MRTNIDQTFELRDLFYYLLRRWRSILLFGLIGGILLGMLTFTRAKIQTSSVSEKIPDTSEYKFSNLTDKEKEKINKLILEKDAQVMQTNSKIASLKDRYSKLNSQLANSLYLEMANDNQFFYEFDVVVEPTVKDGLNQMEMEERHRNLVVEFVKKLKSDSFYNFVKNRTNSLIPSEQVRDLTNIKLNSDDSIHVSLTAPEEILPHLTDAVFDYLDSTISDSILLPYAFSTKIINEAERVSSSEQVQKQLAETKSQMENLSLEIEECEIRLEDYIEEAKPIFVEKYINAEAAFEQNNETNTQSNGKLSSRILLRNIIIGFAFGIFLYILWRMFRLFTNGRLFDINSVAKKLDLMIISQILILDSKRTSKIDRWINQKYLKEKPFSLLEYEDQILYSKTLIERVLGKNTLKSNNTEKYNIGAVSELTDDSTMEFINRLEEDSDLFIISKLSLSLSSHEELKKIEKVNSIILVVRIDHTKIDQIVRFVELSHDMEIKVLGIVAIDCF